MPCPLLHHQILQRDEAVSVCEKFVSAVIVNLRNRFVSKGDGQVMSATCMCSLFDPSLIAFSVSPSLRKLQPFWQTFFKHALFPTISLQDQKQQVFRSLLGIRVVAQVCQQLSIWHVLALGILSSFSCRVCWFYLYQLQTVRGASPNKTSSRQTSKFPEARVSVQPDDDLNCLLSVDPDESQKVRILNVK